VNYDRDYLILQHLELAREVAIREWRTATHALQKDEMISLANLGLVDAADRWEAYCARNSYDPAATQYFKVFARLRIRGTIRDHIRQEDWATRTLRSKSKKLKDAGQDEGVSIQQLAERTEMTIPEINKVNARLAAKPVSLDSWITTDGGENAEPSSHHLKDKEDTEGAAFARDMIDLFIDTMHDMSDDVKVVIVLHYYTKLDLRRIAEMLKLPEAKVSQLHSSGVLMVKDALTYAAQERG
jgi:RNA polymerase sigma factor FliA